MKSVCTPILLLCAACSAPVASTARVSAGAHGCPPACCDDDPTCCTLTAAVAPSPSANQACCVDPRGCCAAPTAETR